MAEQDSLVRMQVWWQTLHPSTQDIFEQLYERDPGLVMDVLSGGEVAPGDGSLGAVLATDDVFALLRQVPSIEVDDVITFDPARPAPNAPFIAGWVERNRSEVPCPAYMDYIQVYREDGEVVYDTTVDRPALDASGSSDCWIALPGLPPGWYRMSALVNSAGAEPNSGMPGDTGFAGSTYATVSIGVADLAGISTAYELLAFANQLTGPERIGRAGEALRSLGSALDTGVPVDERDPREASLLFEVNVKSDALGKVDEHPQFEWADWIDDAFGPELQAVSDALYPIVMNSDSLSEHADAIRDAVERLGSQSIPRW